MKVTQKELNSIKDHARAVWLEGKHGLDPTELIVYSYLIATELVLKVTFDFDLPRKVDKEGEE